MQGTNKSGRVNTEPQRPQGHCHDQVLLLLLIRKTSINDVRNFWLLATILRNFSDNFDIYVGHFLHHLNKYATT